MKKFVENKKGYTIYRDDEFTEEIQKIIVKNLAEKIKIENVEYLLKNNIKDNDFKKIKEKKDRLLNKEECQKINKIINNSKMIKECPAEWYITDEEKIGYENVYWRFVRKNDPNGVGSIHADKWFWDLNKYNIKKNHQRIKIWIPIYQPNDSAFSALEGSHEHEYVYEYKVDELGKRKPIFNQKKIEKEMKKIKFNDGEFIIFNDNLLHGGLSLSTNRLSVEWTMAVKGEI